MFLQGLCQNKVPIALVMTGLEGEDDRDEWWERNKDSFQDRDMNFKDQACITATKGKLINGKHAFEREYAESTVAARQLVVGAVGEPWKMEEASWVRKTYVSTFNLVAKALKITPMVFATVLYSVLKDYGGFSEKEAAAAATEVDGKFSARTSSISDQHQEKLLKKVRPNRIGVLQKLLRRKDSRSALAS